MKLMGADPTCDQINDWFKIGTQVKVATIPQSQLGGYPLDPETGMAAVVSYRPVRAAYKRYSDVSSYKMRGGSVGHFSSNMLLLQHVNFPTRARGTDTPHLLDLVITDDNIIQKIEPLAPLGKSDHVVLIIETNVFSQGSPLEQKLNYDKGDYEALRSYVNCSWNKEFATVDLDVEALWNLLKDKIESGVKCCIPFTTRFQNSKWKRPLNEEIRD